MITTLEQQERTDIAKEEALIPAASDPTTLAVEKFSLSIPEKWIEEKKKYLEFKIFGPGDAEGIKKAHKERMEIRDKRINIANNKKKFLSWVREIIDKVDTLSEQLTPIETHLKGEEARVEKEVEKAKEEKRRLQMERVNKRVERLLKADCVFDSIQYMYGDGDHSLSVSNLSTFTDSQFEEFAEGAEKQKERVDREKEEWKKGKKAQEEADRLAKEALIKDNEQLRIQADKLKKQQEDQQRLIDQQQAALNKQKLEMEQQRFSNRCAQLFNLGLKFNGDPAIMSYLLEDINIHTNEITTLNIEEWNSFIEDITPLIPGRQKSVADREAKLLEEEKLAKEKLIATQKKEQSEKDRAEKERLEALKPDKEKLLALHSEIVNFILPTVSSPEAKRVLTGTKELLGKIATYIETKIKAL